MLKNKITIEHVDIKMVIAYIVIGIIFVWLIINIDKFI